MRSYIAEKFRRKGKSSDDAFILEGTLLRGSLPMSHIWTSSRLETLPDELIEQIFSEECLVPFDYYRLVQTCKTLSRIALQFLYRTYDSSYFRHAYDSQISTIDPPSRTAKFARALALAPEHGAFVRRLRMDEWWSLFYLPEHTDKDLVKAGVECSLLQDVDVPFMDGKYSQYAQFVLILSFTPYITELHFKVLDGNQKLYSLLRDFITNPAMHGFHGLRVLKKLTIVTANALVEPKDDSEMRTHIDDVSYFMQLPSLDEFTISGAGLRTHRDLSVRSDRAINWIPRVECGPSISTVRSLIFTECSLPFKSMSDWIEASRTLNQFVCRWNFLGAVLATSHIVPCLATQKHNLERLVLDVSDGLCCHSTGVGQSPQLSYISSHATIGSLQAFTKLRYLEISGCMLCAGSFGSPSLAQILPSSLEELVLLNPYHEATLHHALAGLAKSCSVAFPLLKLVDISRIDSDNEEHVYLKPLFEAKLVNISLPHSPQPTNATTDMDSEDYPANI
jgi:hypothetical protein